MKTLSTLRDKKRYIAFEIYSDITINRQELIREVSNSIISLFGDIGASEIRPALMHFGGRFGILRCAREKTLEAKAGLACVNNIRGIRLSIMVLGISGTIKGATEKFIQESLIKESEPEKR